MNTPNRWLTLTFLAFLTLSCYDDDDLSRREALVGKWELSEFSYTDYPLNQPPTAAYDPGFTVTETLIFSPDGKVRQRLLLRNRNLEYLIQDAPPLIALLEPAGTANYSATFWFRLKSQSKNRMVWEREIVLFDSVGIAPGYTLERRDYHKAPDD